MSLADRLPTLTPRNTTQCLTCLWYDRQPERDQQAFHELVSRGYSYPYLLEILKAEGLPCEESSLKRHIRGAHRGESRP